MTPFSLTAIDFQWLPILPLITIAIAAIVVLLVGVRVPDDESDGLGWLAIASIAEIGRASCRERVYGPV